MINTSFLLHYVMALLLVFTSLGSILEPFHAAGTVQMLQNNETNIIMNTQPPGGNSIRLNQYNQVTGVWQCGLYAPIPDICMYKDVFPVPPPPNVPPPFPTAKWYCFLDPARNIAILAPWRMGLCFFHDSTQPPPLSEVYSITDANYRPQQKLTKEQKDIITKISITFSIMSAVSGAVANFCVGVPEIPVSKSCAALGGAASVTSGLSAAIIASLALDPSDPNFTLIAQPITHTFQGQPFSEALTTEQSKAINALLENQQQMIGLLNATLISLDRAEGANDVGDAYWENRQMQSAQTYINQASSLIKLQPSLYADLHQALDTNNPLTQTLTITDIVNFQQMLVTDDIPWLTQYYSDLGLDSMAQASIRQSIAGLDASEVITRSNGSYLEILIHPSITTTLQAGAEVFSTGFMSVTWGINLPLIQR